ncbi:MAG TPA: hypothetical protein VH062_13945 [Polyangiaceae bacterium]|jgi:pimeloyl-ACP methyl ester carboxylesterase|nr:hypothetical protein [Polyangiaceae bacterium]
MNPSFFGSSDAPLFGMYHPPAGGRPRDEGVLLCYPAPQEYMRTHWAFRKLATMLTRKGFHVFRFDYFGTGDSAGASDEGSLATWRANVATAASELRDLASVTKISAVGFRLGAAIAATARDVTFNSLVLWEPVIKGAAYIDQLENLQERHNAKILEPPWSGRDRPPELLGFPLPVSLEREIRELDLLRAPPSNAARVGLMVSVDAPPASELKAAISKCSREATLVHVPDPEATGGTELQAALLSNDMLNAITLYLD